MTKNKTTKAGERTQFSVRPHVYPGHYQFVATTAQGRCYQLGFTAPMEPTFECAQKAWKESRSDWEPDNSGGAGATPLEARIICTECGAAMPNDAYARRYGRCARHADNERGVAVLPSVLPEDDGRLVWPEDGGHPSNQ